MGAGPKPALPCFRSGSTDAARLLAIDFSEGTGLTFFRIGSLIAANE